MKPDQPKNRPAFISLAEAARTVGVNVQTLGKVHGFPPIIRMGNRRMVALIAFERWLAFATGEAA